jgi:hypothetical protein
MSLGASSYHVQSSRRARLHGCEPAGFVFTKNGKVVQPTKGFRFIQPDSGGKDVCIDTSSPAGKAMFQMLGVFAEFERAIIVSRVNAGLKRARANGKMLAIPRSPPASRRASRKP